MFRTGDWRRLRSLLTAVLIFAFAAAPSIDRLVCCAGEAVAADVQSQPSDGHADDGLDLDDVCQHSHCHHGAGFTAPGLIAAAARHEGRAEISLPSVRGSALDIHFGLMRPPRA